MNEPINGKGKLPEFKSIEEEAEFWDTHDSTDFLEGTEEVELEAARPLIHTIRIEMDARTLDRLYELARQEGLSSCELAIKWIKERLEQESASIAQPRRSRKRVAG